MTDTITTADKLACVERELKLRDKVYARWVADGKMSLGKATHEIDCIKAIVADYTELVKQERLI